jgi:hypothetical protein
MIMPKSPSIMPLDDYPSPLGSPTDSPDEAITFKYRLDAGAIVSCRYKGGSSQAHPNTPAQLALAQQYNFL